MGCDLGQGNLFSAPLTAPNADALLMREELLRTRGRAASQEERPAGR